MVSKAEHGDVEAHLEFMVPQGSNSGMYFQGRYEIQIFDSWKVENEKLMPSRLAHPGISVASMGRLSLSCRRVSGVGRMVEHHGRIE